MARRKREPSAAADERLLVNRADQLAGRLRGMVSSRTLAPALEIANARERLEALLDVADSALPAYEARLGENAGRWGLSPRWLVAKWRRELNEEGVPGG